MKFLIIFFLNLTLFSKGFGYFTNKNYRLGPRSRSAKYSKTDIITSLFLADLSEPVQIELAKAIGGVNYCILCYE